MEEIKKQIEVLIKVSTLRGVEIKLRERELGGQIVPEIVYEVLKELEDEYRHPFLNQAEEDLEVEAVKAEENERTA